MKTLIAAIALLLAVPSASRAWECKRNPDRFPSFAFNVGNASLSGQRTELDQPSASLARAQIGKTESTLYSLGGDMRLPMNDSLTLSMYYDFLSQDDQFVRQNDVYQQKDKTDGYRYGFSLRIYFNK